MPFFHSNHPRGLGRTDRFLRCETVPRDSCTDAPFGHPGFPCSQVMNTSSCGLRWRRRHGKATAYRKVIRSVRLSVEAVGFKGWLVMLLLFWFNTL